MLRQAERDPEPDSQRERWLAEACRRPEIRPLTATATARPRIDPDLEVPFRVGAGGEIRLQAAAVTGPAACRLLLRHALELAFWQRLRPCPERAEVPRLLAVRVAALDLDAMPAAERDACLDGLPEWLVAAYELTRSERPLAEATLEEEGPALVLARLRDLDSGGGRGRRPGRRALAAIVDGFDRGRPLAAPLAALLAGPDASATGFLPESRAGTVAFAAATGAPLSEAAYAEAERVRQRLLAAALRDGAGVALREEAESVKADLGRALVADHLEVEVILAPSIAAAERAAMDLATIDAHARVDIVPGADAIEAGMVEAAGGRRAGPPTTGGIRGHLEQGRMVLVSASFAVGPPAAALLVPPAVTGRRADRVRALPGADDPGSVLRWRAALWELGAFAAVPPAERRRITAGFAEALGRAIATSHHLEPLTSPARAQPDATCAPPPPTVFRFRVLGPSSGGRSEAMDLVALAQVSAWLEADLSGRLPAHVPESARRTAAIPCRIDAPVAVGGAGEREVGTLGISLGAHHVVRTAFDRSRGDTLDARLEALIHDVLIAVKKTELIAKYFDYLRVRAGLEERARAAAATGS